MLYFHNQVWLKKATAKEQFSDMYVKGGVDLSLKYHQVRIWKKRKVGGLWLETSVPLVPNIERKWYQEPTKKRDLQEKCFSFTEPVTFSCPTASRTNSSTCKFMPANKAHKFPSSSISLCKSANGKKEKMTQPMSCEAGSERHQVLERHSKVS